MESTRQRLVRSCRRGTRPFRAVRRDQATFYGRGVNEDERKEWGAALDLGERARREIRGHALEYYVRRLEDVRATTLAEFRQRKDQWLDERTSSGSGQEMNNYFKWFHVFGHEINHRGQIRWLRTRTRRQS
jgi:hypothetical protein